MSDATPTRTELNTGTTAVRSGLEIDAARLAGWMQRNVRGFEGPLTIEQFRGGQSNPTYKLLTPARSYVLRRKPPGMLLKSAHAVEREYRVLTALATTEVPVPAPLALCDDPSVVGTTFYVMEFKAGRVFWDLLLPDQDPVERAALWDSANDALARLHSIDPQAVGLADFGAGGNYFERQFSRWSEQYLYTRNALHNPAMDALCNWIPSRIPADETTRIVHGDYQFSNTIFAQSEPRASAILDWELSTLGHPLSDFAYFCRIYHLGPEHGGLTGVELESSGIPAERDYLARYLARTGVRLATDWEFYVVFGMFRLAAIRQGVAQRVVDGTATSTHARTVAGGAVPVANAAWRLARSLG
jgi:aminoglycoside phosphotransferase (APT) family kinase protein